jgi:N-acetylneuraminic acid mutarotase
MKLVGTALVALALGVGEWRHHTPLPVARTEVTATTLGHEIAVVGGFLAGGASSREVDLYSPSTDTWRPAPDLPAGVNHAASAAVRGSLYVLGGYGAEQSGFELVAGRWRAFALPAPRKAAGATVLGNTIYVAGGIGATGLARAMLAYDTRRRRWRFLPGPTPRQHLAVTAARGRVYAIAGRVSGFTTNMALVESWAPGERRWRREAPVPERRGGTGAVAVGGTIVSVGGEAPSGTLAHVYAYDIDTRRWRRLADLPTPRHGLGVAALGDRGYVSGGGPQPGLHVSDANESLRVS